MYNILSKYNFITVLPFSSTFFHATILPKKLKFTKELLALNYSKFAPYQNPNIINLSNDKHLMLWFYKQEVDSLIVVPESYIIYKELKPNKQDSIYIMQDINIIKVIIIKNQQLINVFTLDTFDEEVITLSMDEAQVFNKIHINSNEYATLKEKALNSLTLKEFYLFHRLDLDRKKILNQLIDKTSYPLAFFIIFAIFVSYLQENMLESKIDTLKERYKTQKSKNSEIKTYIKTHNKEVKKWKLFVQKELVYIEPMKILDKIYTIFKEDDKAYLVDILINGDKASLRIQTDMNTITFLNRLNDIKYLKRVVIQNTYKPKNEMKIIYYDIEIKKFKEI